MDDQYTDIWSSNVTLPLESYKNVARKYKTLNLTDTIAPYVRTEYDDRPAFRNGLLTKLLPQKKGVYRTRYCPVCAMEGYHSDLHDRTYFQHCFLHPDQALLNVSDAEEFLGQTYDSFCRDNIDMFAIEILLNESSIEGSLDRFEGHAMDIDQIQVIDLNCYSHRSEPYPVSVEQTILALAADETPETECLTITTEELKQLYESEIPRLILATDPLLEEFGRSATVDDRMVEKVLKKYTKHQLAVNLQTTAIMEHVDKASYINGCHAFSEGKPIDSCDYAGFAAALTVASINNFKGPVSVLNKHRMLHRRPVHYLNCPVAPDNLWYVLLCGLDELVKDAEDWMKTAYQYKLVSIISNLLYDMFLEKAQAGEIPITPTLYRKRPEGFDNKMPVLFCVRRGEEIAIYLCR